MCNGEVCDVHGHEPCTCDVIARHGAYAPAPAPSPIVEIPKRTIEARVPISDAALIASTMPPIPGTSALPGVDDSDTAIETYRGLPRLFGFPILTVDDWPKNRPMIVPMRNGARLTFTREQLEATRDQPPGAAWRRAAALESTRIKLTPGEAHEAIAEIPVTLEYPPQQGVLRSIEIPTCELADTRVDSLPRHTGGADMGEKSFAAELIGIVERWQDGGRFANATNRDHCQAEIEGRLVTAIEEAQQAGIDFAEASAAERRESRRRKSTASVESPTVLTTPAVDTPPVLDPEAE